MSRLLTIITVVYNDIKIEETILSVIPFLSAEVEYIIIDGASNDGTLNVINKYAKEVDLIVSEKDKGIYDAMNKALALSKGKFVYHLNAGDFLLELPLDDLKEVEDNVAIVAYPLYIDGKRIIKPFCNWKINYKSTFHHQGTFYRREFVNYDLRYKTFADLDLNQRLYRRNVKINLKYAPIVANHLSGGISSNGSQHKELYSLIYEKSGILFVLISILESICRKLKLIE